ncbi:hypothetical protein AB1Y20_002288 [Prymnesium parvum]|uniref:Cyclic nucleotide-binding domain-containing protein n=1 Tax=Prymnesium parvum TaxID=97485 RepID=A0AB34JAN9_PRYPA
MVRRSQSQVDYDSDDVDVEKQIAKDLWKNHRLFPPTSAFKNNWDSIMLVFVFYNCIFVPVELCFTEAANTKPFWHKVLDNIIDFLFLVDIGLNFRTAYMNADNEMVLEHKLIHRHYMRTWFPLDLFASFPFEIILQMAGTDDSSGASAALGVLKLPRLFRLARILKKLDKLKSASYVRAIHLLTSFLLLAHWLACVWYKVGELAYNNKVGVSDPSVGRSWLQRIPATPLTPESDLAQLYFSSYYWALTMMMKSPWTGPDAIEEKIAGIFIIVFASLCFAVLLVFVSTLYAQLTNSGAVKRDQIGNIVRFSNLMNVPSEFGTTLLNYFDALHDVTDGQDDFAVLQQLPSRLRLDIALEMYRNTLLSTSFFLRCSEECVSYIFQHLKPQMCLEGDPAVRRGQAFDDVLFLLRGSLRVSGELGNGINGERRSSNNDSPNEPVAPRNQLKQSSSRLLLNEVRRSSSKRAAPKRPDVRIDQVGATFGGLSLLGLSTISPFRISGITRTHLVSISCAKLRGVLALFPQYSDAILDHLHSELVRVKRILRIPVVDNVVTGPESSGRISSPRSPRVSTPKSQSSDKDDELVFATPPAKFTLETIKSQLSEMEGQMSKCNAKMAVILEHVGLMPAIIKALSATKTSAAQASVLDTVRASSSQHAPSRS